MPPRKGKSGSKGSRKTTKPGSPSKSTSNAKLELSIQNGEGNCVLLTTDKTPSKKCIHIITTPPQNTQELIREKQKEADSCVVTCENSGELMSPTPKHPRRKLSIRRDASDEFSTDVEEDGFESYDRKDTVETASVYNCTKTVTPKQPRRRGEAKRRTTPGSIKRCERHAASKSHFKSDICVLFNGAGTDYSMARVGKENSSGSVQGSSVEMLNKPTIQQLEEKPKTISKGKRRQCKSSRPLVLPRNLRSVTSDTNPTGQTQSTENDENSKQTSTRNSNAKQLQDTKISDYFPVRRSSRQTGTELKKKGEEYLEECILSGKQDGLEVKDFVGKGRGIVATREFARNDFVVEYAGELLNISEAKANEVKYRANHSGCYMYYFEHKNKNYCIDATVETNFFGRLVNHSRLRPNCQTKIVEVKSQPRLVLLALKRIEPGEEILYDYGDRSKESLEAHPWLAL